MNKEKHRKSADKRPQEEKIRQKDPKMIDNVLKTLEGKEDSEKLQAIIAKYGELYDEYRNSQNALVAEQKRSAALQQETEHLTTENSKLVLARNRLEKLSREFQRQNKVLKEDNLVQIKESEEKRRQMTAEFQKALDNVSNMMAESNDNNRKLSEENRNAAKRLTSIYEEVKNRQTEVDKFTKQIELERQLAETRFAKLTTEFTIEKERLVAENDILKKRADHLTLELKTSLEKSLTLEKTIADLRGQMNSYTGRYEEFQKTIGKTSKIFDQCKSEIASMNEQIYNQKKELLEWQSKHQKNLLTIRELSIINDQKGKFIDQVSRKQAQLTKLCRQLQAERTAYIQALRTNGHNPDDFLADLAVDETEPEIETFKPDLSALPAPKVEKEPVEKKNKRGKQKNKEKAKEAAKRNEELNKELFKVAPVVDKEGYTVKERQLADLKEELKKIQSQVATIKKNDKATQDKPDQVGEPSQSVKTEATAEDGASNNESKEEEAASGKKENGEVSQEVEVAKVANKGDVTKEDEVLASDDVPEEAINQEVPVDVQQQIAGLKEVSEVQVSCAQENGDAKTTEANEAQ